MISPKKVKNFRTPESAFEYLKSRSRRGHVSYNYFSTIKKMWEEEGTLPVEGMEDNSLIYRYPTSILDRFLT